MRENSDCHTVNSSAFHRSLSSTKFVNSFSKRVLSLNTLQTTAQNAFEKNELNNIVIAFFHESFNDSDSLMFFDFSSIATSSHADTSRLFNAAINVSIFDQHVMKETFDDFIFTSLFIDHIASNIDFRVTSLSSISEEFNLRSISSISLRKRQTESSFTTSRKKIKSTKKMCICTMSAS
jgi:hypothetical protein